jgi:CSLREA domain-containing protein
MNAQCRAHRPLTGGGSRGVQQLFSTALVCLFVLTVFTSPAFAIDYTVTKTADTNDGVCDADCSLREAIAAANAHAGADRVVLGAGSAFVLSLGRLTITDALTIDGAGSSIDGGALDRVFDVQGNFTVTINNLTITGGVASGFLSLGGGLTIRGAAVVLNNCAVTGNSTAVEAGVRDAGGGIAVVGSYNAATGTPTLASLTLNNSTVSNNTGSNGGGIVCVLCSLTISSSAISGNTATGGDGGGVTVVGNSSNLVMTSSALANNAVSGGAARGGGLSVPFGSSASTLSRDRIASNTGSVGSAIFNGLGTITASNNWWGCNFGPGIGGAGCAGTPNAVSGAVTTTPELVLKASAFPTVIPPRSSSTMTADLTVNSSNVDTSSGGTVPGGTVAAFSGTLGTFATPASQTSNGKATDVYTAGVTQGNASLGAIVDGQSVSTSITIACATITLSATTFPIGTINVAYPATTLIETGGIGTTTFAVTGGALPAGMMLSIGGTVSGTPTVAATFNFIVTATDGNGCTGNRAYALTISLPPLLAQLTLPPPGSTLTASTLSFQWTSGNGPTDYWLSVGTAVGGANLFNHDEGTSLSQTVTGLPADSSTVYVRLWSLMGGTWLFNDYAYTAPTAQAQLTTPVEGATLTASSVPFQWTTGTGVTDYWLYLGTTVGGANLFSRDEGLSLNQTVTGVPTDGRPVYVRLWSEIAGVWLFNDYLYATYAVTTSQAQVTTPAPGSMLTAASVPFQWTSGTGASQYWLYVGTTVGGADLFNQDEATSLSQTVTGLPANGSTVYLRLWSLIGGMWLFNDYPYTTTTSLAQMLTPVPASTLPASIASFQRSSGTGVTDYWLYVGTMSGAADIFNHDQGMSLSQTVTGVPANGSTVYVRLWSLIAGVWLFNDYSYTAVTPQAQMTTPAPGSTLRASSVSFQWTHGTGASEYWLYVGTTPGGADLFNQDEGIGLSQTETGLPTNGSPVYVRLWSLVSGAWLFNDYAYTTVTPQAQLTAPAPGSRLTGSTVWFQWTPGTGLTGTWLYLGTSVGAADLLNQNEGMKEGEMVTGLPTNGSTVYVRLWSQISGVWQFIDYFYMAH